MLDFYAHRFIELLDLLERLKGEIVSEGSRWIFADKAKTARYLETIILPARDCCTSMGLDCSKVQAERILRDWNTTGDYGQVLRNLQELTVRVRDELKQRFFYCVSPDKANYFELAETGELIHRSIDHIFGNKTIERFGVSIGDDLYEACRCFICERSAACVFHLMRAVEIAIPKIAKLCDIRDPKPSWGAVLDRAEMLTQKTRFEDLPPQLKPHIDFLRAVVADMRSMQRAWRNKVTHVEDRIVVTTADFSPQIANEIFIATKVFLRDLANDLPEV